MTIPRVTGVVGKSVTTSHMRDRTDPCTAVVMGAGGDLMRTREANRKKLAETEKKDASG